MVFPVLFVCFLVSGTVLSQSPKTSGADTTGNRSAAKITDTGFLRSNIKQQIIDIQLAQLAEKKADAPRVRQVARLIIDDGRENLRRMLAVTGGQNLQGVSQAELNQALGTAQNDSSITMNDPQGDRTSGNTITDSLGSGSSGSGNVTGEDTGTLARSRDGMGNTNLSESGDSYAYNNQSILAEAEMFSEGKSFNSQWVGMMLKVYQGKVDRYNDAVSQVKDPKLKVVISQAIPKIRMHNSTLLRLSKRKDLSSGHENQNPPSRINQGATGEDR